MAGSNTYSNIVETTTRGDAELRKLTESLDKFSAAANRASVAGAGKSGGIDPAKAAADAAKKVEEATRQQEAALRSFAGNVRGAIQDPLGAAGAGVEKFLLSYGKVGAVAIGAGAGLVAGGVAALAFVSQIGEAAEATQNLADRTGLTVSQVDRFQAMAKVAGVNVESLAQSGKRLAATLSDTGQEGQDARASMSKLGVSLYDAQGNSRDLGDVLGELLPRLGSIKSRTEQLDLATKTLGRGATELLPLIRNYKELDEVAKSLGFGGRDELIASLAKADDAVDKLGLSWDILKGKLAGGIVGEVEIFFQDLSEIRDRIAGTAEERARKARLSVRNQPKQNLFDASGLDIEGSNVPDTGTAFRSQIAAQNQQLFSQSAAASDSAKKFLDSFGRTVDGMQNRLREIDKQRGTLFGALSSGNITDPAARGKAKAEFNSLGREKLNVEAAIKASGQAEAVRASISAFIVKGLEAGATETQKALAEITKETADLLRKAPRGETARILAGASRLTEAELSSISNKRFESQVKGRETVAEREAQSAADALSSGKFQARGGNAVGTLFLGQTRTAESVKDRVDAEQRSAVSGLAIAAGERAAEERSLQRILELSKSRADFDQRRIELLAGPGGELTALQRITDLKLQQIDQQAKLGAQIDVQVEKTKTLQDAELKRLEILKSQKEAFKSSIGSGFDALVGGGASGLKAFGLSQITGQLRTVATNVGGELFSSIQGKDGQGKLSIGGQKNADGSKNLFGRLLSGTLFADNSGTGGLKTATDLNTDATRENTLALRGGAVGGGGTATGTLAGLLGLPTGIFAGAGANPTIFSATGGVPSSAGLGSLIPKDVQVLNGQIQVPGFASSTNAGFLNQYGSKGLTAAVYGAAIAGGAAGVYAGVKQGGAKGALTVAAAGLGTAAALDPEPVSKAVLAIAAVAAGLATQYFPDPKKAREKQIDEFASGARYSDPGSSIFETDFTGGTYDTNTRGDIRPTVNVYTMDAKSFLDHADNIGDAVMLAIDNGHRINRSIQAATLGI